MKLKLVLLSCLAIFLFMSWLTFAQVPKLINYQGLLTNSEGQPIDTTVSITFSIYPNPLGGDYLWRETQTSIDVQNGLFNVLLGSFNPVPDSAFSGGVKYLGVKTGDDPELSPRTLLVSVPYAYNSEMLDGRSAGSDDGDIPVNNGSVNVNLNADYLDGYDSQNFLSPVKQVIRDTLSFLWSTPPRTKSFSPSVDPSKSVVLLGRTSPIAYFLVVALYADSIKIGAVFEGSSGSAIIDYQIIEYK
ncbi:MAG: hypothetical protein AMJ90_01225 [candidate division Zixibacteria bacterium SM23_73_2]|nr:MAG: hypothetical protein AMJ90_01225 [candidate division Zixibacteria bacterium SM23_73_2]